MKIAIKTKYTSMSFEMTAENANEIITKAVGYAQAYRRGQDKGLPVEDEEVEAIAPVEPEPVQTVPFKARVLNEEEVPKKPYVRMTGIGPGGVPQGMENDGYYRGFLHIRCEHCGKEKSWNARIPTKNHHCECGHWTEMKDLLPVHINCKCGGNFKYLTNIKDDGFTMTCLNCGDKLELVKNLRETAFVNFGRGGYGR